MPRISRFRPILAALAVASLLYGCGEGRISGPQPPPPPAGIGPLGGTVTGPQGARVVVPAGALAAPTVIVVEQSGVGAPPVPTGLVAMGPIFAFTPHGTTFAVPVTITVPFDPATVPPGRTPSLYKTTAGRAGWERVAGATVVGSTLVAEVTSFSNLTGGSAPPVIQQQPQPVSVTEPGPAGFTVTIDPAGVGPVTYQWERSTDQGVTWVNAPGASATTPAYTIPVTSYATDNGARYRVIATNPDGPTVSAVVTLTVAQAPPVITTEPLDASSQVGGTANFLAAASGSGLTWQWQVASATGPFSNMVGETSASLALSNVQSVLDGARFRVVVTNPAGSVTSRIATLTLTVTAGPGQGPSLALGQSFSLARATPFGTQSWGDDLIEQLGAGFGNQSRSLIGNTVAPDATAIGAGLLHGLAVRPSGQVQGWGYNFFGQLGDGGNFTRALPVTATWLNPATFPVVDNARAVCGGNLHSLILRSVAPFVAAMGRNDKGQLGDGSLTDRSRAVPAVTPPAEAISCGAEFSMALATPTVLTWGDNASGQLGLGHTTGQNTPQVVPLAAAATAIAAGEAHALALLANGEVWAWGSNPNGQLGPNGTASFHTLPVQVSFPNLPPGVTVSAIAAGADNSAAVMSNGEAWVWGINETGQLGRGSLSPGFDPVPRPIILPGGCHAAEVAIGREPGLAHLMARCVSGAVYAWGWNMDGQLGLGHTNPIVTTPTRVVNLVVLP